jgi:hypothetical protein
VACCCRHAHHPDEAHARAVKPPAWRWWIDVVAGELSARVELRRLVGVRVDGFDVVRLDDVWAAAHLAACVATRSFDFVSDDGFRLGAKQAAGVDVRDLSTGYMRMDTRDLVWQPLPERPCFWRVKAVAQMLAIPIEQPSPGAW